MKYQDTVKARILIDGWLVLKYPDRTRVHPGQIVVLDSELYYEWEKRGFVENSAMRKKKAKSKGKKVAVTENKMVATSENKGK